jgi:hypothetical protein
MFAKKAALAIGAKEFLAHQLMNDLPRAARKRLAELDWDRDVLNRAGLQRTSTLQKGLGGLTLFCLGMVAGGVAALMLAPKPGAELRTDVKSRAQSLMQGSRQGLHEQAPAEA